MNQLIEDETDSVWSENSSAQVSKISTHFCGSYVHEYYDLESKSIVQLDLVNFCAFDLQAADGFMVDIENTEYFDVGRAIDCEMNFSSHGKVWHKSFSRRSQNMMFFPVEVNM